MLIGFIIGGFIFFALVIYFVVLILFPEWVGVSGRDHQKRMEEQKASPSSPSDSVSTTSVSGDTSTTSAPGGTSTKE